MADPYSAILGAASEAATGMLSAIPYLVPQQQSKYNRSEMKKLKKMAELGQLGLTEEEKQQLFNTMNQAAQAARSDIASKAEAATQAYGTSGAGRQLAVAKAGEEAIGRVGTQIGSTIKQMDIQREAQLRQELEDRMAAEAARKREIAGAITSILMPVIGSLSESGAQKQTVSEKQPEGSQVQMPAATSTQKKRTMTDEEEQLLSGW